MADQRTRTSPQGVPRLPPRDTHDVVRDALGALEAIGRDLDRIEAKADAANKTALIAVTPPRLEWPKIVSILLVLAGGFATVVVKLDRAIDREEVERRVGSASATAEQRARALELELGTVERRADNLAAALAAMRLDTERRLGLLEKRKGR